MLWKIIILLMSTKFSLSLAPNEILILILSQPDEYHSQLANSLRSNILNQSLQISKENPINVHLTHEVFNHIGDWTILYMLPNLFETNLIDANIKWIVFCEDQSGVNLQNLLKGLGNIDHSKEIYLGNPQYDQEATIIHHFAFFEYPKWFPYPLLRSGVAFSKPLLHSLQQYLGEQTKLPRTEFFIDASHELSYFIWQNIKIENSKLRISATTENKNKSSMSATTAIRSEETLPNDDHQNASDDGKAERIEESNLSEYENWNNNATTDASTAQYSDSVATQNTTKHQQYQHLAGDSSSRRNKQQLANNNEANAIRAMEKSKQTEVQETELQQQQQPKNNNDVKKINQKYFDNTAKKDSTNNKQKDAKSNNNSADSSSSNSSKGSSSSSISRKKNTINQTQRIKQDADNSDNNKNNNNGSNNVKKQLLLVNASSYFCSENRNNCAIYPNQMEYDSMNNKLCSPINQSSIYFAIKTCQKFHKERIPLIESTWAQYVSIKRYFSDVKDIHIPTITTGIPNTESGHCAKALQILRIALNEIDIMNRAKANKSKIKWIVLSDDDTLLSISSICDILGCYNPLHSIYWGERYGYRLHAKDGFNYITGGGGIVFSLPTANKIIKSCTCPQESSPDDMIIGTCLRSLGIYPIHSSRFHQARPTDYSSLSLAIERPVSFHKFWQIDPVHVYRTFLNGDLDKALLSPMNEHKMLKRKSLHSPDNNTIKSCDDPLEIDAIQGKLEREKKPMKKENLEQRRRLQAFSKSVTSLLPKSKLFQHVDL